MHNFKRIMRATAFIIVVIVLMNACNFIFAQSGYTRYIIHQVDNPGTKDGYDTVIIGASHGRAGVDPAALDEYGASDNAVNLCIPGAFIRDNYYLLREAAAHNKIKKVILGTISTGAITRAVNLLRRLCIRIFHYLQEKLILSGITFLIKISEQLL